MRKKKSEIVIAVFVALRREIRIVDVPEQLFFESPCTTVLCTVVPMRGPG